MSPFKCLFVISVLVCTVVTARRTIRSTNHYCLPLSQYQNPPNGINQCGRKECPRYTELNGHVKDLTNVTVRRVEAGVYATRTSTKCNLTDALIDSYLPLHYYFYGQEVRMNRTIPIMLFTTKMPAEHRCDYTHQLQFYLPLVNHTNYPDPTEESRVQVTAKQEECFVVYHWIGKITTQATYNNYFNLKTNLTDSDSFNLAYNDNTFAHARYDPSCRPGARHEIWIPLDSCPGAAESSSSD